MQVERTVPERIEDARKRLGVEGALLPTLTTLIARHGSKLFTERQFKNLRYLAPFPCICCGSHVARINGSRSCAQCWEDGDEGA